MYSSQPQSSKSPLSDTDIVTSVLNGNLEDYGILINRYEPKLKRYIMRLSNISQEDADDILQDVFIKAYYNLADFDQKMSFSAWIYRIAHNTTISHYRKQKARPHGNYVYIDEKILQNLIHDDTDILSDLIKQEDAEKLVQLLEELEPKYKEVLWLRYFENKDYSEISDILQIPKGTVSTLLYRAKKKLKSKLKKYE